MIKVKTALLVLSLAASPAMALNVGVVDAPKVLDSYPKARAMLKKLKESETKLRATLIEKRKQIQDAKDAKKSQTEIQMLTEKLKLELEPHAQKLQTESDRLSDQIESSIKDSIRSVAKVKKFDVVLQKDAVLYGGTDVTEEVIKKLK